MESKIVIPFRQSPNYSKGSQPKIGYVFHGTLGNFQGAVDWLSNGVRQNPTSAHYIIGRNQGEVIQIVRIEDEAWHAGVIDTPNAKARKVLVKNGNVYENPNRKFIGIEFACGFDENKDGHVGRQEWELTDWQYQCAMAILEMNKWKVPINPAYLLSHSDINAKKADDMTFAVKYFVDYFDGDEPVKVSCSPDEVLKIKKGVVDKIIAFLQTL